MSGRCSVLASLVPRSYEGEEGLVHSLHMRRVPQKDVGRWVPQIDVGHRIPSYTLYTMHIPYTLSVDSRLLLLRWQNV